MNPGEYIDKDDKTYREVAELYSACLRGNGELKDKLYEAEKQVRELREALEAASEWENQQFTRTGEAFPVRVAKMVAQALAQEEDSVGQPCQTCRYWDELRKARYLEPPQCSDCYPARNKPHWTALAQTEEGTDV